MSFFGLIFSLNNYKLKNMSQLKFFNVSSTHHALSILILFTLSGLPPLISFVGKFFLFQYYLVFSNIIFYCLFFLFNCFVVYFYISNLRLIVVESRHKKPFKTAFY